MQRKYTGEDEKSRLIPRISSYDTMEGSDGKYIVLFKRFIILKLQCSQKNEKSKKGIQNYSNYISMFNH